MSPGIIVLILIVGINLAMGIAYLLSFLINDPTKEQSNEESK